MLFTLIFQDMGGFLDKSDKSLLCRFSEAPVVQSVDYLSTNPAIPRGHLKTLKFRFLNFEFMLKSCLLL